MQQILSDSMEIVPGIHMVDGSIGCNTYLVLGEGVTLVDTGLRGNVPRIYNYLGHIGYKPRDIKRIVITHAHLDHMNCLYQLKKDTGATVMANARDSDIVEGRQHLRVARGLFGIVFGAFQVYYKYRPVPVDVRLNDGDMIAGLHGFRAISLPGHSEGNMGLFSQEKSTFFSSDSIRVSGDRLVAPSPRFTMDMDAAVASIRRIGEFDFNVMLPGHGPAITSIASVKVRELYREIRQ
jgi:glyoxylase-like metal-dependent hydrolase (beta-lactamase superfamily II)